jgi:GT2 family glycosyltransferase
MKGSNFWRRATASRSPQQPAPPDPAAGSEPAEVTAAGSPLHLDLDTPASDSRHTGTLVIGGWAFSLDAPVTRVEALLDGVSPVPLDHGHARPDVTLHLGRPDAVASGYAGVIPLAGVAAGAHTLVVRATDEWGRTAEVTRPILVDEVDESVAPEPPLPADEPPAPERPDHAPVSRVQLQIDEPHPEAMTASAVLLRGWSFSSLAPIAAIDVLLNGQVLGQIPYGLVRLDVKAAFAHFPPARCGFQGYVELPTNAVGLNTLLVRATDTLGASIEQAIAVQLVRLDEPVTAIERVTWERHVLDVEGWAVWPASTPPQQARVFVDEQLVGETRIKRFRPDIGRRFPHYAAAVRSGFRLRQPFTPPRESTRAEGGYEVAVELVDATGYRCRLDTPVAFSADPAEAGGAGFWAEFSEALAEFSRRMEREPTILDWHAAPGLAEVFPEPTIFAPLTTDDTPLLPYLDRSIDIVVVRADAGADRLAEASRVAAVLVLRVGAGSVPDAPREPVGGDRAPIARHLTAIWRRDATDVDEAVALALPSVSIVIPVHNQAAHTGACLAQLVATLPARFTGEIIVVDDASSDDTPALLARWSATDARIRILHNSQNLGFLHTSNHGAAAARGEVIVFLNNDTLPQPGWLSPLLRVFHDHPDAGAVGGKLLYPDGTLQEAGGVIFADGSGCNFGKHDLAVDAPLYNYLREVDYCSGALLATRRTLFERLGGFDTRFAPAYYEDTDYCFGVREAGYRVYYQPESVVVHVEGGTSGTDLETGAKRYQVVNQARFVEKWQDALRCQPAPLARLDFAALQRLAVRDEYGTGEGEGA